MKTRSQLHDMVKLMAMQFKYQDIYNDVPRDHKVQYNVICVIFKINLLYTCNIYLTQYDRSNFIGHYDCIFTE